METYFLCCLILLSSFVEVLSEKKIVYRGESVLLFANVTADRPGNDIDVYINGLKDNTLIACWKFENQRLTFHPRPYYNISMDENMNIWMYNVNENYTGKYSLLHSSRSAVELIVLEKKFVYRGESVILFRNVTADIRDNAIQVYIIGVKDNTLIASWKFKNERFTLDMKKHQNIVMDVDGNICIYNIDENYTGNYSILNSTRPAIELIVLVNRQIKSENPSQDKSENPLLDTLLWKVGVPLLALLVFLLFLYEVYKQKCRKKNQALYKTKDPDDPQKDNLLVNPEETKYVEEINEALQPLKARMDAQHEVIQELAKKVSSETTQYTEEIKEALRHLKARMDDQHEVIQELAEKVSSEKPQYVEELMKSLRVMEETMKTHDQDIKQLKETEAKCRNDRDKNGDRQRSSDSLKIEKGCSAQQLIQEINARNETNHVTCKEKRKRATFENRSGSQPRLHNNSSLPEND